MSTTYALAQAEFLEQWDGPVERRSNVGYLEPHLLTPDVIANVRDHTGALVEVSWGIGLFGAPLWGLTWGRQADGTPDERDQAAFSTDEVIAILRGQQ